jgi:hypothetical protein
MAFREAYWTGRAAAAKEGKEFDDAAKAAVAKLNAYVKAYPRSWEVWQIARDSARLSLHLGDSAAALASWKTLADNTELPLALRHEALLYHAGLLLRGGDLAAAKAAVMEIKADPRLDVPALKEQLAILIEVVNAPAPVEPKPGEARVRPTDAIAKVEAAINLAKSPVARAAGYNALGDLLAIHKLYRDAMWAYLWVDTVYNQDVDQQLRATSRLVEIFRLLNDDDRAALFEERLAKLR